jgi:TolB protein
VRFRPIGCLLVLLMTPLMLARPAGAVLELDITQGVIEPLPIAITEFYGETAEAQKLGTDIADVVSADLERSGLFRPLDRRAFIQSPAELQSRPRFADWRQINAQAMVTGAVTGGGIDDLEIDFRLWDVYGGNQMRGLRFAATPEQWRRVAHRIADAFYERITGKGGYFDTQITYVSETGPATNRVKRIAVMDQDGANHRFLTDGSELVLTPQFSPDNRSVVYVAYRGLVPHIYRRNLLTQLEEVVCGDDLTMTFAPQFSPDGRQIAITRSQNGNADIFMLDIAGVGRGERLTDSQAIDTSPSFSPDGRQIVFNSDRAGNPHLYVMDLASRDVQRISFGDGQYGSPAWSPTGEQIAFTKIKGGYFHVGVMAVDGSDERLLTRSTLDEEPSWAPNGQVILFSRKDYSTDRIKLMSIDVSGYNEREIPTPLDGSDPSWSNLLP